MGVQRLLFWDQYMQVSGRHTCVIATTANVNMWDFHGYMYIVFLWAAQSYFKGMAAKSIVQDIDKCLPDAWLLFPSKFITNIPSGPGFNIKMPYYQYRKSHCGDKTILRPSYLHNGISYTGKMPSLYWTHLQIPRNSVLCWYKQYSNSYFHYNYAVHIIL